MRIVLSSHAFAPSVGGIETCSLDLARAWRRMGHEVTVLTQTLSNSRDDDYGFSVARRPVISKMLHLSAVSDIVYHNNISLKTAWPALLLRRRLVVTTATWLTNAEGRTTNATQAKRFILRFAKNIYISKAIAAHVGLPGRIIPNPYDDHVFRVTNKGHRDRDLVFVGRLVSDKGGMLLLEALSSLAAGGLQPSLTVIGDGDERGRMEAYAAEHLGGQVSFAGRLTPAETATLLNRHRVLVVPSLWDEPFGLVALEGIACGCAVIASSGGGLPDAVGPCGLFFPNGDVAALAAQIREVVLSERLISELQSGAREHLEKHRKERVAAAYLDYFTSH